MIEQQELQASPQNKAILEQIKSLKQEDETLHNILAVDVWALAQTMDEFYPGFWSAFMKNREKAFKRFMKEMIQNRPSKSKRPPFLR